MLGSEVNNLQFADDLAIYCSGDNISDTSKKLNLALKKLHSYFQYLNLEVSPTKSKIVVFSKKKLSTVKIQYNDNLIPIHPYAKFLGVIFTHNLSWYKYVDCIAERALRSTNILRSLVGTQWGADSKILLTLYKALVRSHFDYSFFCYCIDSKLVNKLEKIQNINLRLILGAFKSTPINSMQIKCNLCPLNIRFSNLKYNFILRLLSETDNLLLSKLLKYNSYHFLCHNIHQILTFKSEYNIHNSTTLPCYGGTYGSKFCSLNIEIDRTLTDKYAVYNRLDEYRDFKQIYTDGSKCNDNVSMAYYVPAYKLGHGLRLPSNASIYTAEAQGIYAALEYIEATNLNFKKWLIISDSMSVLMALSNPSYSSGTNYIIYNIRQIYSRLWLNQDREIRFIWTPSHIDVSGNDLADKLASSIVKNPYIHQIPIKNIKLPGSDCKVLIKNIIKDQWMTHWHETIQSKGKWYSSINSDITQPWFIKGKFINRNFYSTICRLRLGHGRFNEHLFRLKMIPSPNCTYCNNDIIQSLDHIFFDCSAFNLQRIILIDNLLDLYKEALDVPRSIQDLLKNTDTFYPIYEYIKNTIGVI